MSFKWHPDEAPPQIHSHSKAKLAVLRSYLRAYFDRLNLNPQREEFKLDLIDGFAGGGLFSDGNRTLSGTPLIMLEEAAAARDRLNKSRIKPLRIDCKFYFVDKAAAHIDHLRDTLAERGYTVDEDRVVIKVAPFETEIDNILNSIGRRQPRSGPWTGCAVLNLKCYGSWISRRVDDDVRNGFRTLTEPYIRPC